jgi:hypothetical protein
MIGIMETNDEIIFAKVVLRLIAHRGKTGEVE